MLVSELKLLAAATISLRRGDRWCRFVSSGIVPPNAADQVEPPEGQGPAHADINGESQPCGSAEKVLRGRLWAVDRPASGQRVPVTYWTSVQWCERGNFCDHRAET